MNKNVATITDKDDAKKDVTVIVKRPSIAQTTEGQMVESRVFNEGIRGGNITRGGLRDHMLKTGEWDKSKDEELKQLGIKVLAGERQLARGGRDATGKKFTKDQGRQLCIDIRNWRHEQLVLLARSRELDSHTVEGKAENAKFDYFMSVCIFNEDETVHFKDVEDYLTKSILENMYINLAAGELANMIYNYDPEHEKKRGEHKFLVKYGYAREDGGLVNDDKKLIDDDGKLVDDDGRLVDEKGEYVDINGDRVDKEGSPIEDFVEFEDYTPPEKEKSKKQPVVIDKADE
jgi:hypothetical protein